MATFERMATQGFLKGWQPIGFLKGWQPKLSNPIVANQLYSKDLLTFWHDLFAAIGIILRFKTSNGNLISKLPDVGLGRG